MHVDLPEKRYYKIGEVAKAFNVNTSLIRFWEKEFEIIKSKNEKFRVTVSNEIVDFGINGFTGGTNSFKISRFKKITEWQSDHNRFYISFLDGNFYFAAVFPDSSRAVSAKCQIY